MAVALVLAAIGRATKRIRRIEELEQTWGFTTLLCWTGLGGMDHDKVLKSMSLMEKYVIPHFKRASARV